MKPPRLTSQIVNRLASEGMYVCFPQIVEFRGTGDSGRGEHYQYDVSGYRRVYRIETKFGKYKPLKIREPTRGLHPRRNRGRRGPPYIVWLSGFHRTRAFSAKEVGRLLVSAGITHTDGPGNGLLESALICESFGIRMMFQLPDELGSRFYTETELSSLPKAFRKALDDEVKLLHGLGKITRRDYLNDRENLWVLFEHGDVDPLGLFVANYLRNPKGVADSFRRHTGRELKFEAPNTDEGRLSKAYFWEFVRRQYNRVLAAKAVQVRKRFAGYVVSNIHFDAPLQYGDWGRIFDIPCVGIRPVIVDDPDVWRYWVGYATRLIADSTRKLPIISIRANLGAVGARRIPTASTIRFWHSQAIQNGVRGFDFWTWDFSGDINDPRAYFGPLNNNPDPTTLPLERWRATLEISRRLRGTRAFIPPQSDLAVFVNLFGSSPEHWRALFKAYCTLSYGRIFCNFVTDENLLNNWTKLANYKVLIVPHITVIKAEILDRFYQYLENGGAILMIANRRVIRDKRDECDLSKVLSKHKRLKARARTILLRDGGHLTPDRHGPFRTFPDSISVSATYDDAKLQPASIDSRIGRGLLRLIGFDLFAVTNRRTLIRYIGEFAREHGCRDLGWVFDVTLNTLTRSKSPSVKSYEEKGPFPPYLYAHDESP